MVRAYERWDRVRATDSPTAWTYRVALNVARRRATRRAFEARLLRRAERPTTTAGPAGEAWELVRHLPVRQRTAVVLRYVADLPEREIAEAMGVSRGTVSSTLADALQRLRRDLNADIEVRHV